MASGAVKFSTDAEDVMQRNVHTKCTEAEQQVNAVPEQQLIDRFYVKQCVDWLFVNEVQIVGLQFPDELLPYASRLVQLLGAQCKARSMHSVRFYIMADTSYASCCVDVVTARHIQAKAIIHYGDACLTLPPKDILVYHVLQVNEMSVKDLAEKMIENDYWNLMTEHVYLVFELQYHRYIGELIERVGKLLPVHEFHIALPNIPNPECAPIKHQRPPSPHAILGRCLKPCHCDCNKKKPWYSLIYVGHEDNALLQLWLLTHPFSNTIMVYTPNTPDNGTPLGTMRVHHKPDTIKPLRKRLFLVEKLRDASTVGLVCSAVTVADHLQVVRRLKELCVRAGKRHYVLSIGKLNVAKLANFADQVDVFVMISCPFGILLDNTEHVKPVLSVFEAEIALNASKTWTADAPWIADFAHIIMEDLPAATGTSADDAQPDISLITGKVRVQQQPIMDAAHGQVLPYDPQNYLAGRTYQGLENKVGEDVPVAELKEGRSGIASAYSDEK